MVNKEQILSNQDCRLIVKRYLQSEEFKVVHHEEQLLKTYNDPNDAVIQYYTVKIKISVNDLYQCLKFMAKSKITEAEKPNLSKEILSHELIFKCFRDKYSVFELDFVPTFYFARANNLVVFENIFDEGYVFPKHSLDLDHIKLVLKTLAYFHAGSVAYEEIKSKKIGKPHKIIDQHPIFKDINGVTDSIWFETGKASLSNLINLFPEDGYKSEDFKREFNKLAKRLRESPFERREFRRVLCHGFMWGDNFVFKYDDKDNPVKCKLLNFELQQYNVPALDVLHLIYWQTTAETRKHNLHNLLQFYYDSLASELDKANLEADQILPFEEDFKLSIYGLLPLVKLQSACLKPIQNLPLKGGNSYAKAIMTTFTTNEPYKEHITEAISELKNFTIHPELTVEDCYRIIENKIGTTDYTLLDYEIIPLGEMSGYLGDHNRLKVYISKNGQKRILNLFAKFVPRNSVATQMMQDTGACLKEIFMYQKLIPTMKDYGVNIIEESVVPCYFTRSDDVIIFEDFGAQQYKSLDPRQPLAYDVVVVIIKKLAKFHASSIILEEKLSEETNTNYCIRDHYEKEFEEALFSRKEDHRGGLCVRAGTNEVLNHELFLYPDENCPVSEEEMKSKIAKAYDKAYDLVTKSDKFRNVVCHGDMWVSNILVKIINGKPLDCRFIDLQLCRYCPPAQDLLSFLYITTNQKFRKQHFHEMIDLYYNELSQNLSEYGYNADRVFPRDEFLESIDHMTPQAVCQTSIYFQLALINQEIIKEFMNNEKDATNLMLGDRKEFITAMYERDPLFRERAGESMQDLREMCLKYF